MWTVSRGGPESTVAGARGSEGDDAHGGSDVDSDVSHTAGVSGSGGAPAHAHRRGAPANKKNRALAFTAPPGSS